MTLNWTYRPNNKTNESVIAEKGAKQIMNEEERKRKNHQERRFTMKTKC
jgi:hypothetical protein